jgi:hypothetical protein
MWLRSFKAYIYGLLTTVEQQSILYRLLVYIAAHVALGLY